METDIRKTELAVLSLEDSVLDFEIIVEHLKRAGYELDVLRVETEADYTVALQTKRYDVILSDFSLPTFDAFAALALSTKLCSEVPFICVSGMIGEEKAIELIKKGAIDYILKDRLARLPSAVQRALDEAKDKLERRIAKEDLLKSERKYKLVSENITDGIFICKDSVLEFVNPAMTSIFGYELADLRLMDPLELFCAENSPELNDFIFKNHVVDDFKNLEIECVRKDNTKVFVEIKLHYVLNEQAIYGVVHDITEKKQIQKKNMVKAIIQTEEKERAYFAKELHDGIGPLLSTIKLYLQWTQKIKNIEQRDEIILKAEEILEDTLTSVKEISYKLSPHILEYHGLTSAIKNFSTKIEAANSIVITLQSNVHRRLEMEIEVALYRAVIECVNNSLKYSKAKNIYIQINDTGHKLLLQYRDDGQGFDLDKMISEQKGLGLFNLQNRLSSIGGEITMFSKPGLGVDYHFVVMLEEK